MQYSRDFPFVKVAKGKNNFTCEVKEDFIRNGTYRCGLCVSKVNECYHTTADYGPCMSNQSFKGSSCKYRTSLKDYEIESKGTRSEKAFINDETRNYYEDEYSQWLHLENLSPELREWRPCEYFHQLNIALASSHSILNYPMFLSLLPTRKFHSREILILDEAHLLETDIVKFRGLSISKRKWKRYIPNFKMVDHGYNDIEKWIDFLIDLETKMLELEIPEELVPDAMTDTEKLSRAIGDIRSNHKNWIVSEIKKEGDEVISVELKPLDVSSYCKWVFQKCDKTLMMSATILDNKTFCKSLGLSYDEVKIIQVGSDFPLQNRPIHPLNTAYLNSNSIKQQEIQIKIASAIDNLMTSHRNDKGIIHTTSYKQLDFIKQNISQTNRYRLETNPDIPRDEVIAEHVDTIKPTVLISPSLYIGLDLKDDLSRFQIITKVPYPDLYQLTLIR
jgi:ATP-dependent DNA helicase DinG